MKSRLPLAEIVGVFAGFITRRTEQPQGHRLPDEERIATRLALARGQHPSQFRPFKEDSDSYFENMRELDNMRLAKEARLAGRKPYKSRLRRSDRAFDTETLFWNLPAVARFEGEVPHVRGYLAPSPKALRYLEEAERIGLSIEDRCNDLNIPLQDGGKRPR